MRTLTTTTRTVLLFGLIGLFGAPAYAQDVQAQGPMTIERVRNTFAVAPDFKITDLDGSAGGFAGAYGGALLDNTLLIGGGAYWLTNDTSHVRDMWYGGAVVQWLERVNRPIGYSFGGLIGGGEATLTDNVTITTRPTVRDDRGRLVAGPPVTSIVPVHTRTDFFVAEPQANLLVNLTPRLRVVLGGGYRLTAGAHGDDSRLHGATGSIALQFGGSPSAKRP